MKISDDIKFWIKRRFNTEKQWHRLAVLADHGFKPQTIFDIGVAYGTFGLYWQFPHAAYHLIDPDPRARKYMNTLAKHHLLAHVYPVALGVRDTEVALDVRSDMQGSTLLTEADAGHKPQWEKVRMQRFDTLFSGKWAQPSLMKIDVQGVELDVLMGMGNRLNEVDVFVVEVSTLATLDSQPELADMVVFMAGHGYVVFDIIDTKLRPLDGATAQMDVVFVRKDSVFRADRRWQLP